MVFTVELSQPEHFLDKRLEYTHTQRKATQLLMLILFSMEMSFPS